MPLSAWLGRISFPLYLVQYPVLVSLTTTAIVAASSRHMLDLPHAAAISIASTLACLMVAVVFTPVETLTRRVGQIIARSLVKERAGEQAGERAGERVG